MSDLTLFDLEPEAPEAPTRPAAPTCGWGHACHHPAHTVGPYERPANVWGTTPCHECGAPLNRYLRCGHWNLDATTWDHLRAHAHQHRTLAMDGRLWIGHPERTP
jgi:hypothetical protein